MGQMYAVVREDGTAVSFGTQVADPLPAGLSAIAIDHQPAENDHWDPEKRAVVYEAPKKTRGGGE